MEADIGNRIKKLEKRLHTHVDFKVIFIQQRKFKTDEEYEAEIAKYIKDGYMVYTVSDHRKNPEWQKLAENVSN